MLWFEQCMKENYETSNSLKHWELKLLYHLILSTC